MKNDYDPGQRFSMSDPIDPDLDRLMRELTSKPPAGFDAGSEDSSQPTYELLGPGGPVLNLKTDGATVGLLISCLMDSLFLARQMLEDRDWSRLREAHGISEADADDQDLVEAFRRREQILPGLLHAIHQIHDNLEE